MTNDAEQHGLTIEELGQITEMEDLQNLMQEEYEVWQAEGFLHPDSLTWPQNHMRSQLFAITEILVEQGVLEPEDINKRMVRYELHFLYSFYRDNIENVKRMKLGLPPKGVEVADDRQFQILDRHGNPINPDNNGHS